MRASIDVFDDGIFLFGVKVFGTKDDPMNVVVVVAILADEFFGSKPTHLAECMEAWISECRDLFLIRASVHFINWRVVDSRPFDEIIRAVW